MSIIESARSFTILSSIWYNFIILLLWRNFSMMLFSQAYQTSWRIQSSKSRKFIFCQKKKIMLEFLENCCDSGVMPKFLKQPKSKQGQSSQQLKNLVRHAMKENIWRRYWTIIILWRSNGIIERINSNLVSKMLSYICKNDFCALKIYLKCNFLICVFLTMVLKPVLKLIASAGYRIYVNISIYLALC